MPTLPSPPSGPCINGATLILAYVCSAGGVWSESPVLVDSAELVSAGEAREGVPAAAIIKPHGCGCSGADAPAVIAATVDAVKAGYEMGLRAAAK